LIEEIKLLEDFETPYRKGGLQVLSSPPAVPLHFLILKEAIVFAPSTIMAIP